MAKEKIINILGIDYIISSDGHIYSTKNIGRGKYHKEISQRKNSDGYMDVTVGPKNFRTTRKVHRLVAEAFIPNPDNLQEIDHIDRIRHNNDVSNLRWISHEDNVARIPFEVGSAARSGENNGRAKVTWGLVEEIRNKYENENYTIASLSKEYNIPNSTVHNIVHYNTWKKSN